MNATMLTTPLMGTAVATPAWMVLQKKYGQPHKARGLMVVGLLMAPIFLAKWLAPAAWMVIRTMSDLFSYQTVLPFVLGIAVLVGGLLVFLVQILGAFLNALGDVDWLNVEDDSTCYTQSIIPNDPNVWFFGLAGDYDDD
jgi:cation transport ATPase